LEEKVAAAVKKAENTAVGIRCADHATPLDPQKLALTLPTSGGRSVGIVCSETQATEFQSLEKYFGVVNRVRHDHFIPNASQLSYHSTRYMHSTLTLIILLRAVKSQSRSHVMTDGQSVCLCVDSLLVLMTGCLFLFDGYCRVFVGRPL
jgi:hypothetical protein